MGEIKDVKSGAEVSGMLSALITIMSLQAATPVTAKHNAEPGSTEIAPVEITVPRRPAAKSHQQLVADRWSSRIVTCRGVFVQGLGIVRRECATNRDWEVAAQRERHTLMQTQWHWVNW